jgi:hypothetical protein
VSDCTPSISVPLAVSINLILTRVSPLFAAFDSILDDYLPPAKRSTSTPGSAVPPPTAATASGNAFDAFLGL